MQIIIITMLICWMMSFIGFYFMDLTGKDGWIFLVSPLSIIPYIIIKIYEIIKNRTRTCCIKEYHLNRFHLWVNFNRPKNLYMVNIIKDGIGDSWGREIELYNGDNKKEAFNIYNKYAKMTEDELEIFFREDEEKYEK